MKKCLSSFLTLLLAMPLSADVVEFDGIYYNLIPKGGVAEVTENPNQYAGNIEIPASVEYDGKTYEVTTIAEGAFMGDTNLTSVKIPNSIVTIGNKAFQDCSGLTTVNFNATNCTQMDNEFHFGHSLFSNLNVTTLNIGENVTIIPFNAFSYCSGLTSVTIPG